jgi:hypothetical protein
MATMLWNDQVPKIERAKLLASQPSMMSDWYYFPIYSGIITNSLP